VGCEGWQVTSSESSEEREESLEKKVEENLSKMESTVKEAEDFESAGWSTMEYMNNLVKIGKPAVPKILEVVKDKSKNPALRSLLIHEVLAYVKDPRSVEPLIEIMKDEEEREDVRDSAIRALARIGDNRALQPIVDMISSSNEALSSTALWALRGFSGKEVVDILADIIRNSDDPSIRDIAVDDLGRVGDRSAIPILIDVLKNDPDAGVRSTAALCLGSRNLKSEEGIAALEYALKNDPKIDKTMVIMALGNLGVAEPLIEMLEGIEDLDKFPEMVDALADGLRRAKDTNGKES